MNALIQVYARHQFYRHRTATRTYLVRDNQFYIVRLCDCGRNQAMMQDGCFRDAGLPWIMGIRQAASILSDYAEKSKFRIERVYSNER